MAEFKGGYFKGREGGELEHRKTLYWHDGPIVFTALDNQGQGFLCVATGQGTGEGEELAIVGADVPYALFKVEAPDLIALEEEGACFNTLALKSARRYGGVETWGVVYGEHDAIIRGPRLTLEQAQDVAIGEPIKTGGSV